MGANYVPWFLTIDIGDVSSDIAPPSHVPAGFQVFL